MVFLLYMFSVLLTCPPFIILLVILFRSPLISFHIETLLLAFLMRILYHVSSHEGERIWTYFAVKTASTSIGMPVYPPPGDACLALPAVFLPVSEVYC